MTVKDLITQNPDASFDMMTPGGFVYLTPETAQALLNGESTLGHPGDPEMAMEVSAEELLPQIVDNANFSNGVWRLLTDYSQEQLHETEQDYEQDASHEPHDMEQGMIMQ
jgi:hypothetical protein